MRVAKRKGPEGPRLKAQAALLFGCHFFGSWLGCRWRCRFCDWLGSHFGGWFGSWLCSRFCGCRCRCRSCFQRSALVTQCVDFSAELVFALSQLGDIGSDLGNRVSSLGDRGFLGSSYLGCWLGSLCWSSDFFGSGSGFRGRFFCSCHFDISLFCVCHKFVSDPYCRKIDSSTF